MERDDFIIYVYCWVCDLYQAVVGDQRLRQRGFAPALTDEEVITMEICGEYFGFHKDTDIFRYFRTHYQDWFPALRDRTTFMRQAANLWHVKMRIQRLLVILSGALHDDVQIIDTLPLPVCVYTRSARDRCFKPYADYGYCAAKRMHYYGFKLGLRISRIGMIVEYPLLPARPHGVELLDDLVDGFSGVAIGDKGFIDAFRHEQLARKRGVEVIAPPRKNMKAALPPAILRPAQRWRKRIETVISQLTERFDIERTRARDLWHYQHRLIRKILAHTICVFINLQLGRPPLDLAGLVTL